MRIRRFLSYLALGVAALLFIDMYFSRSGHPPVPEHLPDITLPTLEGKSFSLGRGDSLVTLLVFWATWCQPCIAEIPHLTEFHEKYREKGFRVVSINIDDPEGEKIPAFVERFGINYPLLIDDEGRSEAQLGGIDALPTSFLIDRNGRVARKLQGLHPPEAMDEIITGFL